MSESPRIQRKITVSFDLDGLLVKNFFVGNVFPRIFQKHQQEFIQLGLESLDAFLNCAKNIHEQRLEQPNPLPAFDWDSIVTEILSPRLDLQQPFKSALSFALDRGKPQPYREVRTVLNELDSLGGLNAVVFTNGFVKYQRPILLSCNIAHYFSRVYGPDRIGYIKPQPESFQYLKDRETNYCLHVGDKIETDVRGAATVDLTSWLVRRGTTFEEDEFLDACQDEHASQIFRMTGEISPRFLSSSLKPAVEIISCLAGS